MGGGKTTKAAAKSVGKTKTKSDGKTKAKSVGKTKSVNKTKPVDKEVAVTTLPAPSRTALEMLGYEILDALRNYYKLQDVNALVKPRRQVLVEILFDVCPSQEDSRRRKLSLPHPLNESETACLIVKSPQRFWKDKLAAENATEGGTRLPMITRVIELDKLKKKFSTPALRKELLHTYDNFYCDKDLIEKANVFLGKTFFQSWKQPMSVRLEENEPIHTRFLNAYSQTTYRIKAAPSTGVRIGCLDRPNEVLMDNALAVILAMKDKLAEYGTGIKAVKLTAGPISMQLVEPLREIVTTAPSDDEDDDSTD